MVLQRPTRETTADMPLKEQKSVGTAQHYQQEQKKIRQLEEAVRRMHEWQTVLIRPMHRRAFSMEKRIERLKRDGTSRPKKEQRITRGFRTEGFSGSEVVF